MTIRTALAAGLLVAGTSLHPQQIAEPDARWNAWLGCWTSTPVDAPAAQARVVCIAPTSRSSVVDVIVIASGDIIARDTIDATGTPRPVETNGCAGTETAIWSADSRRIFLRSSVACGSAPTAVMAILAITPDGEWLDVRGVASPTRNGVHVERYRPVDLHHALPPAISAILTPHIAAIETARTRTGARIETAEIIEASRAMEPAVVEAWLLESGQTFATNDSTLKEMKDAGVPQQITDALIVANTPSGARYVRLDELYGGYSDYNIASNAWEMGTGLRKVFVMPLGTVLGLGNVSIYGFPYYDPAWQFGALPSNAYGRRSGIPNLYPPVIKLANTAGAQGTEAVGKTQARTPESRVPTAAAGAAGAARAVVEKLTTKGEATRGNSAPTTPKKTPASGSAQVRGSR